MEKCLYYLSCFGCFGFCCKPKFVKKDDLESKKKTIQNLKDITTKTKKISALHPKTMKTKELAEEYEIPGKEFKTVKDVMASKGYIMGEELGHGAQGIVYKAIHQNGLPIAVKVCQMPEGVDKHSKKKRKRAILAAKRELFILQNLKDVKHPHIIQLYHHLIITTNTKDDDTKEDTMSLYILIQFAEKGNMRSFIKRNYGSYGEREIKVWFAQMLSAMVFMHNKGYAHRDLKLENILLDQNRDVLIADFGMSQVVPKDQSQSDAKLFKCKTYCGTPPYMAPEVLIKKEDKAKVKEKYDPFKADVWSLGCLLYYLLNNNYPFDVSDNNRAKALRDMKEKVWRVPKDNILPLPLRELLIQILEHNPNKRLTMADISRYQWISAEYRIVEKKCKNWMKTFKQIIP